MHFIHCPYCGTKLIQKEIGDDSISAEVDSVEWFALENALDKLREGSIAWQLVKSIIKQGR